MLLFKDKPEYPPSAAAEAPPQFFDLTTTFKQMLSNKNFGHITLIFVIGQASASSFVALVSDILTPFGFTPEFMAVLGLVFLLSGVCGGVLIGFIIDRTQAFKKTLIAITFIMTISMIVFLTHLDNPYSMTVYLALILNSGCSLALLPTTMSFAIELTFPAMPAQINSAMLFCATIGSMTILTIFNFLLQVSDNHKQTLTPDDLQLLEEKKS